jgi:hypothetical protein
MSIMVQFACEYEGCPVGLGRRSCNLELHSLIVPVENAKDLYLADDAETQCIVLIRAQIILLLQYPGNAHFVDNCSLHYKEIPVVELTEKSLLLSPTGRVQLALFFDSSPLADFNQ